MQESRGLSRVDGLWIWGKPYILGACCISGLGGLNFSLVS